MQVFSAMHDIYDPPPVPEIDWKRPKPEPLIFSRGDVVCLVSLCALLLVVAVAAWRTEPLLAVVAAGAGPWWSSKAGSRRWPTCTAARRWA